MAHFVRWTAAICGSCLCAGVSAAQSPSTSSGQAYTVKPVRFLVGFPPGGTNGGKVIKAAGNKGE